MNNSFPADADYISSTFSALSKHSSYIDMHFATDNLNSFRGYFPLDEDSTALCFVEMFLQEDCYRLLCVKSSVAVPSIESCSAVELCLSRDYFDRFTSGDFETILRRLGFGVSWFHLFRMLSFLREGQVTDDDIENSNLFELDNKQRTDIGILMLNQLTSSEALTLYRIVTFERVVDGLIQVFDSLVCDQFNSKDMNRFFKLQESARNASDYFLSDEWDFDRSVLGDKCYLTHYLELLASKDLLLNVLGLNEKFNLIIRDNIGFWIEQLEIRCFYLRSEAYGYIKSAVLRPIIKLKNDCWEVEFNILPRPIGVYPELLILERDYFEKHTVSDLQFILRAMGYDTDQHSLLYDIPILKPGDYSVPEDQPFLSRNLSRFGIVRRITGRIDRSM